MQTRSNKFFNFYKSNQTGRPHITSKQLEDTLRKTHRIIQNANFVLQRSAFSGNLGADMLKSAAHFA